MNTQVDIPKFDWFERYKRLIDIAWGSLLADEDFVYHKWGKDAYMEFLQQTRPKWTQALAKRLIEKLALKPDIEGAIKLLGVYSQEIWGFGDPQFFEAKLETPTKGTFSNLVCRAWEKAREHSKETHCDISCGIEYAGVVSALSPDIKVTITKARPRGDDRCQYTVEIQSVLPHIVFDLGTTEQIQIVNNTNYLANTVATSYT